MGKIAPPRGSESPDFLCASGAFSKSIRRSLAEPLKFVLSSRRVEFRYLCPCNFPEYSTRGGGRINSTGLGLDFISLTSSERCVCPIFSLLLEFIIKVASISFRLIRLSEASSRDVLHVLRSCNCRTRCILVVGCLFCDFGSGIRPGDTRRRNCIISIRRQTATSRRPFFPLSTLPHHFRRQKESIIANEWRL